MYTGVCVCVRVRACVGTIALARASVLLSNLRLPQSVIEECRAGGRENESTVRPRGQAGRTQEGAVGIQFATPVKIAWRA